MGKHQEATEGMHIILFQNFANVMLILVVGQKGSKRTKQITIM